MLNSIDSFFQYFVKRMFSMFCYFSAKRMPYIKIMVNAVLYHVYFLWPS